MVALCLILIKRLAWANYLGSPEYGAIVSNNGGGYSFVKSGANGSTKMA